MRSIPTRSRGAPTRKPAKAATFGRASGWHCMLHMSGCGPSHPCWDLANETVVLPGSQCEERPCAQRPRNRGKKSTPRLSDTLALTVEVCQGVPGCWPSWGRGHHQPTGDFLSSTNMTWLLGWDSRPRHDLVDGPGPSSDTPDADLHPPAVLPLAERHHNQGSKMA